jgi:hypothetical protein
MLTPKASAIFLTVSILGSGVAPDSILLAEAKRRRAETLGGIVASRAPIKSRRQDFVQNRFGFCPKGTNKQINNLPIY